MLSHLYQMAASIIHQCSSEESTFKVHIGGYWIICFLDSHSQIVYCYSACDNNEQVAAENPKIRNQFFNWLADVCHRFHILLDNTYNANKKGYTIGLGK